MVEIPEGESYYGLEGPDILVHLAPFSIDRTEVTRGAFNAYGSLEAATGDEAAHTSYLDLERPGKERLPVVGVNAFTAANYCRFMGKELPAVEQWEKAVRGGITVNGALNPDPKRETPWSKTTSKHPRNIMGEEDGFPNLAPVGSFVEDTSPYGVVDLGGNVSEWSRTKVDTPEMRGLRYVMGANWFSPPEHADWWNMRPDRYLDFAIGIRCVSP